MFADLCGFMAGNIALSSVSLFGSATSTTTTISYPASTQAGDVAIILDRVRQTGGTPTQVIPTGFTAISNLADIGGSNNSRQIVSGRVLDGSEGASITGMAAGTLTDKLLFIFRGNRPILTYAANDIAAEIVDTNPTSQTCNAAGAATPLVVVGFFASDGAVSPRTFSPSATGEINSSTRCYGKYLLYDASPADVTIDMGDEGNANGLQSFYLTFT